MNEPIFKLFERDVGQMDEPIVGNDVAEITGIITDDNHLAALIDEEAGEDSVSGFPDGESVKGCFSLDYLNRVVEVAKQYGGGSVQLELVQHPDESYPMLVVSFENSYSDGGQTSLLLAPRNNDGEDLVAGLKEKMRGVGDGD